MEIRGIRCSEGARAVSGWGESGADGGAERGANDKLVSLDVLLTITVEGSGGEVWGEGR